MVRAPTSDKDGLKKGPWTSEEDQKLIEYLNKHGDGRWKTVPKGAGLNRCGKSCRLRWTNYLRPDIKRGRFTFEEEETIIQLHSILGNKWSAMAARLPGRTDNEIKNYWNTHIRKRLLKMGIDPVTHKPRMDLLELCSILNSPLISSPQVNFQNLPGVLQNSVNANLINLITSLALSQCNNLQYFPQNHQLNQDSDLHAQNQFQPSSNTLTSCDPQLYQAPLGQYSPLMSSNSTDLSQNSCHQFPGMAQNLVPLQDVSNENQLDYSFNKILSNNQLFQNTKISDNNWNYDFGSVISTPSSSSTPMNSSTTFVNGSGAEDEKDCTNIMSRISNPLDINDYCL